MLPQLADSDSCRRNKKGEQVPTTSVQPKSTAVVEIERLGFSCTEVAEYEIEALDYNRRVQVREEGHYNPRELVERYAVQMGETAFPPIVVTNDGWIVDGNTRVEARKRIRKEKFSPALVLDVSWATATPKQKRYLNILAGTLNANSGLALTAKEARELAADMIKEGFKAEQIGRAIGMKAAGVTQVKKEIDAAEKLKRVGLDTNGSLKGASLRALGAKDVLALNDAPYRELATLAADAGFNASEITSTAREIKATGADDSATKMLGDLRLELNDRIRERELTGVGKPPVSRQLRQALGNVTKFVGREHELIETDPNVSVKHIETLKLAIAVLSEVLRLQEG